MIVGLVIVSLVVVGLVIVGQVAVGQVAVGQVAVGQVAFGQVVVGQVAVGQVTCWSSGLSAKWLSVMCPRPLFYYQYISFVLSHCLSLMRIILYFFYSFKLFSF